MPSSKHCMASEAHSRWALFHCMGAKTGEGGSWSCGAYVSERKSVQQANT